MIDKIIGAQQRLPVPYLGSTANQPPSPSTPPQAFILPKGKATAPPVLQSQAHMLHIQSPALAKTHQPPSTPPIQQPSPTTLKQIQTLVHQQINQHPVKVNGISEQELLLLMAIHSQSRAGAHKGDQVPTLVPSEVAMLSFLATEKPFDRQKVKKSPRLKVGGKVFVRFRLFDWDEPDDQRPRR